MKKHLIAAAVAAAVAAPAMAQNVEIYGVLSTGYEALETSGETAGATTTVKTTTTSRATGAQGGNRLGFRGTEDLGGGMKAGFVYELGINNNTTGLGAVPRLAYLDLSGSFGTVRAGRIDGVIRQIQNSFTAHGNAGFAPGNPANNYSLFAAAAGLPAAAATNFTNMGDWGQANTDASGQGRISNSIGYITPTVNDFTGQVYIAKVTSDTSATPNKAVTQDVQGFGLRYAKGPLAVLAGLEKATTNTEAAPSVATEYDSKSIGASYNFGVATGFLAWTDRERTVSGVAGATSSDDLTVGVRVPLGGATTLIASLSDGKMQATGAADFKIKGYHLGLDYALSKRTKLYAQMGETEAKQSGNNSAKLEGLGFGIYHNF